MCVSFSEGRETQRQMKGKKTKMVAEELDIKM